MLVVSIHEIDSDSEDWRFVIGEEERVWMSIHVFYPTNISMFKKRSSQLVDGYFFSFFALIGWFLIGYCGSRYSSLLQRDWKQSNP